MAKKSPSVPRPNGASADSKDARKPKTGLSRGENESNAPSASIAPTPEPPRVVDAVAEREVVAEPASDEEASGLTEELEPTSEPPASAPRASRPPRPSSSPRSLRVGSETPPPPPVRGGSSKAPAAPSRAGRPVSAPPPPPRPGATARPLPNIPKAPPAPALGASRLPPAPPVRRAATSQSAPVSQKPNVELEERVSLGDMTEVVETVEVVDELSLPARPIVSPAPPPVGSRAPSPPSVGRDATKSPAPSRQAPPRPHSVAAPVLAQEAESPPVNFLKWAAVPNKFSQLDQDSDVLPTRFDVEADQRHASPWSEEKRQQTQLESARSAVNLFEGQLKDATDKLRRARLHYEAARLYESPLRDFESAAKHFEHSVKLQPGHVPSIRGARRCLLQMNRHKAACRFFDLELEHSNSPEQKAVLLYQKSQVLAAALGSKPEARDALREAVALSRLDLAVVKAALFAEEQAGNWQRFAELSKAAANLEPDSPKERAAYLTQAARAHHVHLKDIPGAIELYKSALELDARAPGALDALKDLLYGAGRFKELADVLRHEADWTESPEVKGYCWFRVGRLLYERLNDAAAATSALEWASQILPADRTILEELLRVYELTGDYANAASAAERIVALTEHPPIDLLHRLAELYEEHLNDPERAIERLGSALYVAPSYRPALLALGRLREQRGEWRELAEMLSAEAEASDDPEHRATLHARMAEICELHLGSEAYAVEHHKQALALRPGFEPSFKALVRLHSAAARWHALIELYERQVEVAVTREERVAMLFSIGRLHEDALGQPASAIGVYRRVLAEEPHSLEGLAALQRAAERAGDYPALVEALDGEAKQSEQKLRVLALKHRAATLVLERLGEVGHAAERFEAILKIERSHLPSIEALQRIYHREGRLPELLQTYEKELDATKLASQRAALLVKMGELCQRKLGQPAEAVTYYRRALQADETNVVAMRSLRLILTQTGDYAEVAKLLGQEADGSAAASAKARLWLLQGEVYEHRLNVPDKALAAYRRAVQQEPGLRPAAEGCLRILALSQDYKRLEEELQRETERLTDPVYLVAAAFRRGEVQRDRLGQTDDAAASFKHVRTADPAHAGALLALERVLNHQEQWEPLAEVLEAQVNALTGVAGRVAALRSLRAVRERNPNQDVAQQKELDTAILRLLPNDLQALHSLEALAVKQDDHVLLSQVDSRLAVVESDKASMAAHQTRLGEAMEARGDTGAIEVYRAAVSLDTENLAAARGISRIAERSGSPELLAVAAETEAGLLDRPSEAARLLVLAASRLVAGGVVDGAAVHLSRALKIEPNDAHAATAIASLIERGASSELVLSALSDAAAAATDKDRRCALWLLVARHYSTRRDVGAAVAAAKRAIREQPTSVEAHTLLAQLHANSRKWQDCVTVLSELLKLNPSESIRFDALLQTAFIQHEHLKATTQAASNVSSALAIRPDNRDALSLLLRIQLSRDDLRKASDTAARLVQVSTTSEEKAEAHHLAAKVEHQRGDHERASLAYRSALGLVGPKGRLARDFKEYLDSLGTKADWRSYVSGWQEYLSTSGADADTEKAIRQEVGRVLYDKLGSHEDGISSLKDALRMNPNDYTLRRELADRLELAGHFGPAVEQFHILIQAAPQTASFWRSLSHCYAGLHKTERARLALAPLVASGDASKDERARYGAVSPRVHTLRAGAITARDLAAAQWEAPIDATAVEVAAALQPALPKLYPVTWENYGITARDKISGATSGVGQLAREVAAAFGVVEYELYVHRSKREGVAIEMLDLPAVFVNERLAGVSHAEQLFGLAQAFAHLALGTGLVHLVPPAEAALVIAAAVRGHVPGFGQDQGDSAVLDAQARRVSKAMPWFKGNRLEPASLKLASAGVEPRVWVSNARVVATRLAALVCDDLATSLRLAALAGTEESFVQRVARFQLTEAAEEIRRRVHG